MHPRESGLRNGRSAPPLPRAMSLRFPKRFERAHLFFFTTAILAVLLLSIIIAPYLLPNRPTSQQPPKPLPKKIIPQSTVYPVAAGSYYSYMFSSNGSKPTLITGSFHVRQVTSVNNETATLYIMTSDSYSTFVANQNFAGCKTPNVPCSSWEFSTGPASTSLYWNTILNLYPSNHNTTEIQSGIYNYYLVFINNDNTHDISLTIIGSGIILQEISI